MSENKLHRLLERQIRRHLKIDSDSLPDGWEAFIQAANAAYVSFDEDRVMLERTLELSSQELLQANHEMGEIYKAFPDLFFHLDKSGTIISYKAGSESDKYFESDNFIGKKIQQIPVAEAREKFEHAVRDIREGMGLVSIEYEISIKNEIQHYEARLVPLLEDHIFVVIRNITSRKRAREEIIKAKESAEAANIEKSQFLANMSHELRTPLNAIIGYSEIIRDDAHEQSPAELNSDIGKIISSSKHLLSLINDVLDLAKIEAKKMELHLETFNIRSLINDTSTTIAPLLETNSNTLKIVCADDIGVIHTDPQRLQQVLYNLLSNACKFTEHGNITIKVGRSSDDWIEFHVDDTGIGIAANKLGTLFEAFSQIDASATRSYEGTGLGLAISTHLIEMMGGEILVESVMGKGSKFTIRLPAALPSTTED